MAVITLISDFSHSDASVAIAKGILLQYMPDAVLIDISHDVQQFNRKQCAYLLAASWRNFPPGSFHISLADVFYGSRPALVMAEHNGHYFLAPDNGILPQAFKNEKQNGKLCMQLEGTHSFPAWMKAAADTIESLLRNKGLIHELPAVELKVLPTLTSGKPDVYNCEVVDIDAFDNVVIDFTRYDWDVLGNKRPFVIKLPLFEPLTTVKNNYNEVKEGEALCRFNSSGYLEICIYRGRAASLLGLKLGKRRNLVQIEFK